MKRHAIIALAAMAVISSCTKDILLPEKDAPESGAPETPSVVFTATMEGMPASKATLDADARCASWEVGDQISINGVIYKAQTAGTATTFTAATESMEASGDTYNAYFACNYDGIAASLPSSITETWSEGKFNMPMYASSTDDNLEFRNLCGVLKISVSLDNISRVKSIKVSSSNRATSGTFTVSDNAAVLTDPAAVSNTTTVTYTDEVAIKGGAATAFYIPIPAQTYRDLKIEISNTYGTKSMTTASGKDITVERNKIYPIWFADNAPITGTAKATIAGKDVDVPWVQLMEYGPKWAVYNLGVTDGAIEGFGELYKWGTIPLKPYLIYNEGSEPLYGNSDTATSIWGSNWRMPTSTELEDLFANIPSFSYGTPDGIVSTKVNGIIGVMIKGVGAQYKSNSLFLPLISLSYPTNPGVYWSSTPYDSSSAWSLQFAEDNRIDIYPLERTMPGAIRPVLAE